MTAVIAVWAMLKAEFDKGERGATAVEYAIMAGFIAVVIVAAVTSLGAALIPIFTNMAGAF